MLWHTKIIGRAFSCISSQHQCQIILWVHDWCELTAAHLRSIDILKRRSVAKSSIPATDLLNKTEELYPYVIIRALGSWAGRKSASQTFPLGCCQVLNG
jgi:hypothetical protein